MLHAGSGGIVVTARKRDPNQLGCGFCLASEQINAFGLSTLADPWQSLHCAVEHTFRLDFGMEASMASGERAAIEIASLVREATASPHISGIFVPRFGQIGKAVVGEDQRCCRRGKRENHRKGDDERGACVAMAAPVAFCTIMKRQGRACDRLEPGRGERRACHAERREQGNVAGQNLPLAHVERHAVWA